jgi:EAL domain-containing protein (putative c-di-GMP-specific phosphodiesterase class I)
MDVQVAAFDALVIDDDEFARNTTVRALGKVGAATTYGAATGAEALAMLGDIKSVDLIICDLNMPGIDGVETLRRLSARNRTARIILVSSADPRVMRSAKEMAAGFGLLDVQTMAKPLTVAKLREAIGEPRPEAAGHRVSFAASVDIEEFHRGLTSDELTVYYQPKVSFSSRRLVGAEALVRWVHPIHGMLPPGVFLPVAERGGKLEQMTDFVLRAAVAQCAAWQQEGVTTGISVNLPVVSLLSRDLPNEIERILADHSLDPDRLTLEVTEDGWLQQKSVAREVLTRLRLRGFGLSIDDYGTGYSTPQQLLSAPFSEMKLDQSFVRKSLVDDESRIVLTSSILLAHELKLAVVAEGVETADQWRLLEGLGCDEAQGYLIARPMPGELLPVWLQKWGAA